MKKILSLLIFSLSIVATAQRTYELAVFTGSSYYLGDVNHSTQLYNGQFSTGGFFRQNIHKRVAFRYQISYGQLFIKDSDFDRNYQQVRNYEFRTSLIDISVQSEFNFLPYKLGVTKHTSFYTPYILGGIGWVNILNSEEKGHWMIPMGIGCKFSVSKKLELGCEWSFRKTFSDYVDNFAGIEYDVLQMEAKNPSKYKQRATYYTKDWYAFIGVYLSYKLFQSGSECKAYDY